MEAKVKWVTAFEEGTAVASSHPEDLQCIPALELEVKTVARNTLKCHCIFNFSLPLNI